MQFFQHLKVIFSKKMLDDYIAPDDIVMISPTKPRLNQRHHLCLI